MAPLLRRTDFFVEQLATRIIPSRLSRPDILHNNINIGVMPDRSKRCEQLNDQFPGEREWNRAGLFSIVSTEKVFPASVSMEENGLDRLNDRRISTDFIGN